MENISVISKPIIDLEKTGEQIKRLRTLNGFSVHDIKTFSVLNIHRQYMPGNKENQFRL